MVHPTLSPETGAARHLAESVEVGGSAESPKGETTELGGVKTVAKAGWVFAFVLGVNWVVLLARVPRPDVRLRRLERRRSPGLFR
jgi:hypothetical protein